MGLAALTGAWPPIPLRFVLARLHRARSVGRPGALARTRLFSAGGRLGRGGGPRSGSSLGWGEGGPSPLLGGVGAGAAAACGPVGGVGGGGVAPRPPCSPSGWWPAVPHPGPPRAVSALPSGVRVRGRGAAPGWGGKRGGPWTAPPGAPADLNPPSALPEWAVVMGGSCGARPPYCSGPPPCGAPKLGPRVAPARWCGLALRPRPPREQAARGAGARGVQVQPHPPPPPASRSLLGEGGRPLGSGGAEGRSCGSQAGGGGGGGVPPPLPRPVGRRHAIRCLRCAPPGYTRAVGDAGRPWASGAVRSAANGSVRRGGGGREGGATPPPWFAPPSSPGRPVIGPLCLCRPGRRRSAVGRQRAGRAGACLGRGAPAPRVQRPLRGGCGAAVSSVCLRPPLGLSGRGRGEWGGPSGPLAPPPDGRGGGRHGGPGPGGQPSAGGSHPSPTPLYLEADPRAGPRWGPFSPTVVARRWAAGGGREG